MLELIQANASWIVLALAFLLMMRMHGAGGGMGCCGGHQHGAQERRPDEDQAVEAGKGSAGTVGTATIAMDPVCGMEVDPTNAVATAEYKGRTYYFCSSGCKAVFEMNPEKFAQTPEGGHRHRMIAGG